ncbi:uncharacterized protein IL334_003054 [Kwoniella shivajii]|uniref:Uncharacterized protein n=1 Tax=Kwoniella shivajii TaxID=564305 RepID=A0ABZ1CWF8_9TREE|nr:hypothetical protein IL334_003054 [Kwoniella shivajii]
MSTQETSDEMSNEMNVGMSDEMSTRDETSSEVVHGIDFRDRFSSIRVNPGTTQAGKSFITKFQTRLRTKYQDRKGELEKLCLYGESGDKSTLEHMEELDDEISYKFQQKAAEFAKQMVTLVLSEWHTDRASKGKKPNTRASSSSNRSAPYSAVSSRSISKAPQISHTYDSTRHCQISPLPTLSIAPRTENHLSVAVHLERSSAGAQHLPVFQPYKDIISSEGKDLADKLLSEAIRVCSQPNHTSYLAQIQTYDGVEVSNTPYSQSSQPSTTSNVTGSARSEPSQLPALNNAAASNSLNLPSAAELGLPGSQSSCPAPGDHQ